MRKFSLIAPAVAVLVLTGSAWLKSASGPAFTIHDKAYYADPNQLNFVRPGLVIKIVSAAIATDGKISVRFQLTDAKGSPLDRDGIMTPGSVSVSFIAAYIPAGQTQYRAYTSRPQKSPINGVTADQAGTDSGGVYAKVADGEYTYTFATLAPQGFDASATHSIGIYGSRNLTEFDMGTNYDDAVYNFVPNGKKVTVVRDVVTTASCNKCHQDMGFHGGSRKTMELCVLCHQPQTVDPDTGNSVDMAVFIHKLHAGSTLPSVQAGGKYQIIGHNQEVSDWSEVVFPADVRSCQHCHEQSGSRAASQASRMYSPTRAACGSCHDDVDFATGKNHVNQPQVSDNLCAGCHIKEGELEFDASINGAHTIPRFSKQLPGVVFKIVRVDGIAPGQSPTVVFTLTDKSGNPLQPSAMARLNILLTGPNSDYALPGVAAGYVTESAINAAGAGNGTWWWTMAAKLPADATGSYTVTMEGRRELTIYPGLPQEQKGVRDTGANQQFYFSVDGSKVTPRRPVVSNDKCNACHQSIAFHGDNRNDVMECIVCHNPVGTAASSAGQPNVSIEFRTFIHKIHMSGGLTRDYSIGTFNANEIRYPGDARRCDACHVNGSEQVPSKGVLPVSDPSSYLKTVPPTTAACTACHDTQAASAHAAGATTSGREACATCHSADSDYGVSKVHAQ